jgi:hypothetical protein
MRLLASIAKWKYWLMMVHRTMQGYSEKFQVSRAARNFRAGARRAGFQLHFSDHLTVRFFYLWALKLFTAGGTSQLASAAQQPPQGCKRAKAFKNGTNIREDEIVSYTIECKIFNYYCQFGYN